MECKGNIAIFHETEVEESPPIVKKSDDDVKLKGNVEIIDVTKINDEIKEETLENGADTVIKMDDCKTSIVQLKPSSRATDVTKQTDNITGTTRETWKHQTDTNLNAEIEVSQKLQQKDDNELSELRKDDINFNCDIISEDVIQNEYTDMEVTECNFSRIEDENLINANDNQFNSFSRNEILPATGRESTEPENSSTGSAEKASDICSDPCDFCENISRFVCRNCNFFYCMMCLDKLHPVLGPYKRHKVIPVHDIMEQRHEICKEHGVVAQLHCSYCEQKRCVECANTRCFLHFKGRVSEEDIEREKKNLVEELDKASHMMGFVGRYKDMVERELDNIEITGLLRKEQIRQEFVSFHDLLIEKEAKMLEQLELDVQERRDHVKNTLQASVASLEQDDAELTTTVTELVQSENDALFIEEYVKAKDLCAQISDKVQDFDRAWARNSKYTCRPLLDYQFSMFLEKRQLLNKLDATVGEGRLFEFKQKTLFLNYTSEPLQISDYLHIPDVPTSTEACYTMQLFASGKQVYEKETKDILDLTINTETSVQFGMGKRYLLKIYPSFKCLVSNSKQYDQYGNPSHMLIVIDYMLKAENGDQPLSFEKQKTSIHGKHVIDQSQRRLQATLRRSKKGLAKTDRKKEKGIQKANETSNTCEEMELNFKKQKCEETIHYFTLTAQEIKGREIRKAKRKLKCKDNS